MASAAMRVLGEALRKTVFSGVSWAGGVLTRGDSQPWRLSDGWTKGKKGLFVIKSNLLRDFSFGG